ncbi:hypothetical protein LINPERPRIM_LOCUS22953 [Linum perenne]
MGCGVSVFEPDEGTTVAEGQPTTTTNNNNKHIDDADSSPPSAEGNNSSAVVVSERKSNANSVVQPSGLRKIRADVHAITRYNNHDHRVVDVDERNNNSTTSKNLLLPPSTKDGQPLVVAVKAVGGEKTMKEDIKEEHGGEGHKENSILLSHGSPSFRVYCVEDLPPLDDDHDSLSQDDERDLKEDDSEKENKIPTNDGSNKGEEGNRRKKKGGKMRGRGMRSVLPRGGGSGGMRHIFNPHRLRNHSSNHLH